MKLALALAFALLAACGPGSKGGPTINDELMHQDPPPPVSPVVSADILAREPVANQAKVEHILIGWKDTDDKDPRAENRTKAEAEDLVKKLLGQLKAGASFEDLMKANSEDPGSASGMTYDVQPSAELVIEFKQLGLRLNVGEIGVVQSDYGFHIMKRLE